MGLDMYLDREIRGLECTGVDEIQERIDTITQGKGAPVEIVARQEMAYWRKFNALHAYISRRWGGDEDNCVPIKLDTENLQEILDTLRKAKGTAHLKNGVITNRKAVEEILPTEDGFFWGNTEYAEEYLKQVEYAIEDFERILAEDKALRESNIDEIEYYYTA